MDNILQFIPKYLNILANIYAKNPYVEAHKWRRPANFCSIVELGEAFQQAFTKVCENLWFTYAGDPDTIFVSPVDEEWLSASQSKDTPRGHLHNPSTGNFMVLWPIPGLQIGTQILCTLDINRWTPNEVFDSQSLAPYFPACIITHREKSNQPLYMPANALQCLPIVGPDHVEGNIFSIPNNPITIYKEFTVGN